MVLYDNGEEPSGTITAWNGTSKYTTYLRTSGAAWIWLKFDSIDISGYTKMYFTGYIGGNAGSGSELKLASSGASYSFTTTSNRHTTTSSTIVFDITNYTGGVLTALRFSPAGSYDDEGDWSRVSTTSTVTAIWLE